MRRGQPYVAQKIEYATIEQLRAIAKAADEAFADCGERLDVHERALNDLYARHDTMRADLNYILRQKEEARPAPKRRRRVTISRF